MKILVMSDNHGTMDDMIEVLSYEKDNDYIFHCGDYEGDSYFTTYNNIHIVRGNSPFDFNLPAEIKFNITEKIKIFVTHGHKYNVKWTYNNIYYKARELKANIVLFGHSHRLDAICENKVVLINPGSISRPRGQNAKTYVIIELEEDKVTVKGKTVEDKKLILEKIFYL